MIKGFFISIILLKEEAVSIETASFSYTNR